MADEPAAPVPVNENWPLQDPKETIALVRQIVDAAESLTPHEADFLKEIARMARRFGKTFRMTPKQLEFLDDLYNKYLLASKIDAKTKQPEPETKEKTDG